MNDTVESRMQRAAEARLAEVAEAFDMAEETGDFDTYAETIGMWCGGCDTCTVREVLEAAVPILLEAIRNGEVDLGDAEDASLPSTPLTTF